VVSEGDTYEEALTNVKSAIKFHIETFENDVFAVDEPVLEAMDRHNKNRESKKCFSTSAAKYFSKPFQGPQFRNLK